MQKLAGVLLCAFCSFHLGSAARIKVVDFLDTQVDDAALKEFIAETALDGSKFDNVHGKLIGNLAEGLIKAGKVTEITKVGSKLTVKLANKVYGQVATRSNVPVLWVVDETLTAEVDGSLVRITGLHTDVPAQAYRYYEEIMSGAGLLDAAKQYDSQCGDPTSKGCASYLQAEHAATTKWFKSHYKASLKNIGTSQKVGKVLKSLIDHLAWAIKQAISYDNWANIVYSMISATPKTVTGMKFEDGTVVAFTEAYTESSNSNFAKEYNLLQKAQILGADAMTNAPSVLSSSLSKQSKSGWGFGMLFGHGDPDVAKAIARYGKANPAYLANLFSLCEKGSAEEDPSCTGKDIGRLHWTDDVPADYA